MTRSYAELCELFRPQLENVFLYLAGLDSEIATPIGQVGLTQLVETCLSASYFSDRSWKYQAILVATQAAQKLLGALDRQRLLAMITMRRMALAHLFQESGQEQMPDTFPVVDDRSHAFTADLAIVRAAECVKLNALASASKHLADFVPEWNDRVSSLGVIKKEQIAFAQAGVLRCEGRFHEAYDILCHLSRDHRKTVALLGRVLCELGQYDEALRQLHLHLSTKASSRGVVSVELALAYAYVFRCMQGMIERNFLDRHALQASRETFQKLSSMPFRDTYYGKMNRLSVLFGLAMVDHLDSRVESALDAWRAALVASRESLPTGYTDMIISYSTGELEARRGGAAQSDVLVNYARTLFSRTGRQHHFVSLGSLWLDLLGKWFKALGKDPID